MYLGYNLTDTKALMGTAIFLLALGVLLIIASIWQSYRRHQREQPEAVAARELERRRRAKIFLSHEKLRKNCDPVAFRRPMKRY